MPRQIESKVAGLNDALRSMVRVSVAVSGGVDSMTLAVAAHRQLGSNATMFHAISPAVPPEATERVSRFAASRGWDLRIIDAGEFTDPEYLQNPVNRCYFCKSNLYGSIRSRSQGALLSGTNLDDLADYRPGLRAAEAFEVRHPYVEQGIDKSMVRNIARHFDLDEIVDLPASPCLSSRIETGIPVEPRKLGLVHAFEQFVSGLLPVSTVRCRIRHNGVVIELDESAFGSLSGDVSDSLQNGLQRLGSAHGYHGKIDFAVYRMGSAFLHEQ